MMLSSDALNAIGVAVRSGRPLEATILSSLAQVVQDKTYASTTRQMCFKLIAAVARSGQQLPDEVYQTLLHVVGDVTEMEALRKVSAFVLMTTVAAGYKNDEFPAACCASLYLGLADLLQKDSNLSIRAYAACALPYVMNTDSIVPEFLKFYIGDALAQPLTQSYARTAYDILESLTAEAIEEEDVLSETSEWDDAEETAALESNNITNPCKSLDELFAELSQNNASMVNMFFTKELQSGLLRSQVEAIQEAAAKKSSIFEVQTPINQWDLETCALWSKNIRSNPSKALDLALMPELIAVLIRVRFLTSHQQLRDIQIISLLILLNAKEKGRIAEISTGEGKTALIAMFAAFHALQGKKVDVLSSSEVLAHRDAKEETGFYTALGITVADTKEPAKGHAYISGAKTCYLADVVYGDVTFQWDTLRTEYQLIKTRGERPYEIAILDEVDSSLIEEGAKLALLGSCQPDMEQLHSLLVALWARLQYENTTDHFIEQDGCLFWQANKESALIEIQDRIECLEQILQAHAQALISEKDSPILVPCHLKSFALAQAKYWAQSAVMASEKVQLDKDYVLSLDEEGNDTIAPIDFRNTGVTQLKSAWTNGLHQFLQIKHGLALTPETLTTSFISNRGYLSRYGNHLFGVTGTLGGQDSQSLLTEFYPVDLVFVPTFKVKRLQMLPGVLAENDETWLSAIVESAKEPVAAGRAVLILCETNLLVDVIERALKEAGLAKLRRYGRSDLKEHTAPEQPMESGEIMIATSLGARGTNIKLTGSVKQNKGLHTCLTYLASKRGRDQGFARAARNGEEGSAQLIVNKKAIDAQLSPSYFLLGQADTLEEAIAWRDKVEEARLENIKQFELTKIKIQEDLFARFSQLRSRLRTAEDNQYRLADLEERWGFWLKGIDNQMLTASEINEAFFLKSYTQFEMEASSAYLAGTLQNPGYWISEGNRLSRPDSFEAITAYKAATSLDPIFAFTSYYAQARHHISWQQSRYKTAAIDNLNQAKAQIQTYLLPQTKTTQLMYTSSLKCAVNPRNGFLRQCRDKERLLEKILDNIEEAIFVIGHAPAHAHVRISNYTSLYNLFSVEPPEAELAAFFRMGLTHLVNYEEVPEEDDDGLFDAFVCTVFGMAQAVVGVCLILSGKVALGAFFISEGLGDIIYAAQTASNFSWKGYVMHKEISLAISAVCWGLDAAKASVAARSTGRQVAAAAAAPQLSRRALVEVAKKQVTRAIVNVGIRELANVAINAASREILSHFKKEIEAHVHSQLSSAFGEPALRQAVNTLLSLDCQNNNQHYEMHMHHIVANLMTQQQSRLKVIVSSVIDGVLKRQSAVLYYIKTVHDIARVTATLSDFCDNFSDKFKQQVKFLAHKHSAGQMIQLEEEYCKDHYSSLFASIVTNVKNYIVRALHQGVVRPIYGTVLDNKISELSNNVCDALTQTKQSISDTFVGFENKYDDEELEQETPSARPQKASKTMLRIENPRRLNDDIDLSAGKSKRDGAHNVLETVSREHDGPSHSYDSLDLDYDSLDLRAEALNQGTAWHNAFDFEVKFPTNGFALISLNGKDVTNAHVRYVFRGDLLSHLDIFRDGFVALGKDPKPINHLLGNTGNFVSTTSSKRVSVKYPTQALIDTSLLGYVYEINVPENAFNAVDILHQARRKVMIDGIQLHGAYVLSEKSGNYDAFFAEGSRIAGGWSGAFAGGVRGAKTGLAVCRPFALIGGPIGPYIPPTCGVLGGLAGSYFGYMGGGAFGLDIHNEHKLRANNSGFPITDQMFFESERKVYNNSFLVKDNNLQTQDMVTQYMSAISSGAAKGIVELFHPIDNIVRPLGNFFYDCLVMSANHTPDYAYRFDTDLMSRALPLQPEIYKKSYQRMEERILTLPAIGAYLNEASGPERAKFIASLGTSIYLPGKISATMIQGLKNYKAFGMVLPPRYHTDRPAHLNVNQKLMTLTPSDIKKLEGEGMLTCVINHDRQVIITPEIYDHCQLGSGKPAFYAGDLAYNNGEIIKITNKSGSYHPQGPHLEELAVTYLERYGVPDLKGKYSCFFEEMATLPGYVNVPPKITRLYPPHGLTMGLAGFNLPHFVPLAPSPERRLGFFKANEHTHTNLKDDSDLEDNKSTMEGIRWK